MNSNIIRKVSKSSLNLHYMHSEQNADNKIRTGTSAHLGSELLIPYWMKLLEFVQAIR
jgi:hypothetical protein